ncbi:complement decay-accelerating factor-like isoform X1 [Anolis sagrei]|uniref:complement decay-accelerating factor-like isoform X1 n=1 Tax=Anolis sagrei TaxID=38937 RepID=UPI00351FCEC3
MLGSFLSPSNPTLLGLFSLLSGIQGDCGPPPKLSNAIPLNNAERFLPMESVTYRCLDDFYNVYGKLDVATCLSDSTWTSIEEFCERICPVPPRFRFARIKDGVMETYYPAKTRLTYVCRPGYDTIPGIDSVITCLDNYTWTALPVFCEGKSCGDPGKPEHGEVVVLTNLLYSASVNFICDKGYRLIGSPSTKCVLKGDSVEWQTKAPECQRKSCGDPGKPEHGEVVVLTNLLYSARVNFICEEGYRLIGSPSTKCVLKGDSVEWQTKPPECQQIICFSPPNVTNASHDGNSTGNFTYNSTVTYHCDPGFLIIGESSIHCTTENNLTGVWRGSTPECKAITTPVLLTKRPTEKEDNFTVITTRTTSILLTKRPTEKEDNFTGLQLGDMIGIIAPVLVVLCTAVIVGFILWQKKKRLSFGFF